MDEALKLLEKLIVPQQQLPTIFFILGSKTIFFNVLLYFLAVAIIFEFKYAEHRLFTKMNHFGEENIFITYSNSLKTYKKEKPGVLFMPFLETLNMKRSSST